MKGILSEKGEDNGNYNSTCKSLDISNKPKLTPKGNHKIGCYPKSIKSEKLGIKKINPNILSQKHQTGSQEIILPNGTTNIEQEIRLPRGTEKYIPFVYYTVLTV